VLSTFETEARSRAELTTCGVVKFNALWSAELDIGTLLEP